MDKDYLSVTEVAGDEVTQEQIDRLCNRYYWAREYCTNKDVTEAACGTGQGLGYLADISRSLEAGDYSYKILNIAKQHYGDRIRLQQFDAQQMPFKEKSKDVIILFEAIYYLPNAEKFVNECARILRPGGRVLIATANKDLYDFNPSPNSCEYFGIIEMNALFHKYGFYTEFFGCTPISNTSIIQRAIRPIKKIAVDFGLIPKTMAAKKMLKRIVFGKLTKMPSEITASTTQYVKPLPLSSSQPDTEHKVLYCLATLHPQEG